MNVLNNNNNYILNIIYQRINKIFYLIIGIKQYNLIIKNKIGLSWAENWMNEENRKTSKLNQTKYKYKKTKNTRK